jgi:putative RNA 2'-phosphotransferase
VHLSVDVDTATKVGQRHGKPVIYKVNALKMHEEGFKFYISKNGVWLTKSVPIQYLEH